MPITREDIERQEREIAQLISQLAGADISPYLSRRFHEDPADELRDDTEKPRVATLQAQPDEDDLTPEEESRFWRFINDISIPTEEGGDTWVPSPFNPTWGVPESVGENVAKTPFTLGRGMAEMGYNVVRGAYSAVASLLGGDSEQSVEERTRPYWVPPSRSQQKYAEIIEEAKSSTEDILPIVGDLKDFYEVGREFVAGRGKKLLHDQPGILPALALGLIPGVPGPNVNTNVNVNADLKPLVDPVSPAQKAEAVKALMDNLANSKEPISLRQERMAAVKDALDPTMALNKGEIKTILEQAGAGGLPDWEKQAFASTLSLAKAKGLDAKAETLAGSIIDGQGKSRMITAEEHAGMVLRAAQLANEYDLNVKASSDLAASGDIGGAADARRQADVTMKQIEMLAEASDYAGRETARALSIRRMGLNRETFDLSSVVRKAQSIKGRRLTPDEQADFESLVSNHQKAQERLSEVEKALAESEAERKRILAERIVAAETKVDERVTKTRSRKENTAKKRNRILDELKEMGLQINFGLDPKQLYKVGQLARTYIEDGVTEIDDLVGQVKERLPQLSDRDVYEAILSRDPDVQAKAKSELQQNITEIEKQSRLLIGLDDIIKRVEKEVSDGNVKTEAPKTVELRKQLKALMESKRHGEKIAEQIASLEAELAQAEQGIFKEPSTSAAKKTVPRIKELRDQIKQLKKEAGDARREQEQIADLERQIDAAERGEPTSKAMRKQRESSKKSSLRLIRDTQKQLTKIRQQAWSLDIDGSRLESGIDRIDRLQDQLSNLRRGVNDDILLSPDDVQSIKDGMADVRRKLDVEKRLSEAKSELESGEIVPRKKVGDKNIDPELESAQIELRRTRQAIRNRQADMERPSTVKVLRETVNTLRTVKATADMSATFRQGLILAARRPGQTVDAFIPAFKSFFEGLANNDFTAQQVDNRIRSADHHWLRERAGLYLAPLEDVNINAQEEMFMSRWAEKTGLARWTGFSRIVKASEQHMVTFLNSLRASAFDQFLNANPNATQVELKAWADWINIATGRGIGAKLAQNANWMSAFVFAPRFSASRVQAINVPKRLYDNWSNPRVRKEIAKDYAAVASLGATALTLGALAGAEVGDDPRSSDFGKMVVGDAHIDIWGGMQQPMRLITSIGANATDRLGWSGSHLSQSEIERFNPLEQLGRFSSFKLAPSVTIPLEGFRGKDIIGQDVTLTETAINALMPLVWQDVYDAYREEGFGSAARSGAFNFFGIGTNTYRQRSTVTGRGRSSRRSKRSGSRSASR